MALLSPRSPAQRDTARRKPVVWCRREADVGTSQASALGFALERASVEAGAPV